jgi:hypothetical protein
MPSPPVRLVCVAMLSAVLCLGCRSTATWPTEAVARPRSAGGVSCRLYLPVEEVGANGTLSVYFLVANQGARPVVLDGRLDEGGHIVLLFATPSAKVTLWPSQRGTIVRAKQHDFITIEPGFVHGRVLQVPVRELAGGQSGRYRLLGLLDEWEDGRRVGLHAWTGQIRAPGEASFDVR